MLDEKILQRLVESVTPSDEFSARVKRRVHTSIDPLSLRSLVSKTRPSPALRDSLKDRVLRAVRGSDMRSELAELVEGIQLSGSQSLSVRQKILSRLSPTVHPVLVHSAVKWAAAFAVLLLGVRVLPVALLSQSRADVVGTEIVALGDDVQVLMNDQWLQIAEFEPLHGTALVRTGADSRATVLLGTDGIVRVEPSTLLRIDVQDVTTPEIAPSLTLLNGKVWLLGLRSPVASTIDVTTSHGTVSLSAGSAGISDDTQTVTVAMYDRGATLQFGDEKSFLVTGEQAVGRGTKSFAITHLTPAVFRDPWVSGNLAQDAVHRTEIAKLQEERREQMAGALPGTWLYPAKRLAEEVDVLFTLSTDGRSEKRVQQANTRLSEALALIKDGQNTEAEAPLTEYRDSLIQMASGTGDNLVKFLIKEQLIAASSQVSGTDDATVDLVRSAILEVSGAIPEAVGQTKDIEGYALVDKLIQINADLKTTHDLSAAAKAYAEVSPYLKPLLAEDGAHPLLQKETKSLLVAMSTALNEESQGSVNKETAAVQKDLAQYLPAEPEKIEEVNRKIDEDVQRIFDLVFTNLQHYTSRRNELIRQADLITGPYAGRKLRELKEKVGVGFRDILEREIQERGDELHG